MLTQHVRREAIGIAAGVALRISDDVDFTMGLLERLRDLQRPQSLAPGEHFIDRTPARVPESDNRVVLRFDPIAVDICDSFGVREYRRGLDLPDQPLRKNSDQRMLDVQRSPLRV